MAADHGFHFDTVQMPLNVMDAHFRSFGQLVLPELVKQQIGVLGMKSMGDGVILKSKTVSPIECLHYALSLPTSVVITGIEKQEILDQAFEAVKTFKPLNHEQIAQLLAKTKDWQWRESTSCSKHLRTSTRPRSIRIGWAEMLRMFRSWPRRRREMKLRSLSDDTRSRSAGDQ